MKRTGTPLRTAQAFFLSTSPRRLRFSQLYLNSSPSLYKISLKSSTEFCRSAFCRANHAFVCSFVYPMKSKNVGENQADKSSITTPLSYLPISQIQLPSFAHAETQKPDPSIPSHQSYILYRNREQGFQ